MRKAGALGVAAVLLLVGCSRTVGIPASQLPRLRALAARPEVQVRDIEGEEVSISGSTRLTLFVEGLPPIDTRPDRIGFSQTSLRLGNVLDPQAPAIEYGRVARVDARLFSLAKTLLVILIPVGVFTTLVCYCAAKDGGCNSGE